MKKVAIVGYAQHPILENAGALNEVELIMPVVHQLFDELVLASITAVIICSGVMIFFSRSTLACIAAKVTRSGQRGEM